MKSSTSDAEQKIVMHTQSHKDDRQCLVFMEKSQSQTFMNY